MSDSPILQQSNDGATAEVPRDWDTLKARVGQEPGAGVLFSALPDDGDAMAKIMSWVRPAGGRAQLHLRLAVCTESPDAAVIDVTGRAVTAFSGQEMEVTARFRRDGARARCTLLEVRPIDVTQLVLPGVKQVHLVRAELTPGGLWIVDMLNVAADLRSTLAVIGEADAWKEMLACLDAIAASSPIVLKRCDIGVDTGHGELEHVRVEVGGANNQPLVWEVDPNFKLSLARVELTVHKPGDVWLRRFEATIEASVRAGTASINLELSNVRSAKNPRGFWRLAPPSANEPIKFTDIIAFLGKDVVGQLPPWAGKISDDSAVVGLAMAFDMRRKTVASLEGGIELVDIAIPGVASTKAKIEKIALSLVLTDPLSSARELRVGFSGTARIGDKAFLVDGASWGRGWQLAASCGEDLSLTAGIAEIAGEKQPDLFGDFSLSLVRPSVLLGPDSLSLQCGVSVADGKELPIGVGSLACLPGEIRLSRTSAGTRYELMAGLRLKVTGGPEVEQFVLRVTYDSAGREDPKVVLTSAIVFPVDGADPVRVDITGAYTGGSVKGFKFNGKCATLPLSPLFRALAGADLPADFPKDLALSGLEIAFNTADGSYLVTGTLATPSFKIGETAITNSALRVTVKSESATPGRTSVDINGKATVGDIAFGFNLHLANQETNVSATAETQVRLGQFLNAFRPAEPLPASEDDVVLTGVGFRYNTKAPGQVEIAAAPLSELEFYADWSEGGTVDSFLAKYPPSGDYEHMLLLRPGKLASWLPSSELKWSTNKRTPRLRGTTEEVFSKGLSGTATLALAATRVGKLLHISDELQLSFGEQGLDFKRPGASPPAVLPLAPSKPDTTSTPATPPVAPGDGTRWFDRTLSIGPVTIDRIGVRPHKSPTGLQVIADVGVAVEPWFSAKARGLSVKATPKKLSLSDPQIALEFGLSGAALAINLAPWVKLGAAVQLENKGDDRIVSGVGKVEILKKINIGVLVQLAWRGQDLDRGFGFVFATGLALGSPAFKVTGIAGGFGYHCVLELPRRPEDVPGHGVIALLRGTRAAPPNGGEAAALLADLDQFKTQVTERRGAWCLAFGLTFKIAELVDCATLVVVEIRKPGFELALAGVADLPLRLGDGAALGHVQLGLIARFSSSEGTLKILGALTDKSWLIHPDCRLRGGFALCLWLDGPHRGDFLVSLGGYSPLAPARPHYPALDRVGFTWKPKLSDPRADMVIDGDLYFALDRHGIQFGQSARLHYNSESLVVQAHYSFDVLVQWSPLFFEAQMRIGIHIEVRTFITLRLGLDVDMHAWGPPFGAKVTVCVTVLFASMSYTVEVGPALAAARPVAEIKDVLALALAGRPSLIQIGGGARKEATRFRPDDMALIVSLAVPVTEVSAAKKERVELRQVPIDIRPMRRQNVRSILDFTVASVSPNGAETELDPCHWRLGAEPQTPTEALWYYPGDKTDAEKRRMLTPSGRVAITELRIAPPAGSLSTALPVITTPDTAAKTLPRAARAPVAGVAWAVLKGAGFDLDDTRTPGSQPDTRGQS